MEFTNHPELIAAARDPFDWVVSRIQQPEFNIVQPLARKVCKECGLKELRDADEVIKPFPN